MTKLCNVCENPLGKDDVATCMVCGQDFHFAETQTSTTEDCGLVWISQITMALRFMCNDCAAKGHPQV